MLFLNVDLSGADLARLLLPAEGLLEREVEASARFLATDRPCSVASSLHGRLPMGAQIVCWR